MRKNILLVQEYLTEHGYSFNEQYKFSDCKIQLSLPFDFVLLNKDQNVIGAIEYQGEQHYRSIEAWGGKENLIQIQLRDQIKREYCQVNNIPLLEIHYKDKDKTRILQNFLEQIFPDNTK